MLILIPGLLEVSENLLEAAGDDEKKLEMAKTVARTIEVRSRSNILFTPKFCKPLNERMCL